MKKILIWLVLPVIALASCSFPWHGEQVQSEVIISLEHGVICLRSKRGIKVITNEGDYQAEAWCSNREMVMPERMFENPIKFVFFEDKFCMSLQEEEVTIYWMDGEEVDEIETKKEFCYSVFSIPDNRDSGGETYLFGVLYN